MADFYGTNAGADAYFIARGNTTWGALTEPAKASRLLIASEYVDARYRGSFPGIKTGDRTQIRDWPRTGAFDRDYFTIGPTEIPREVENATYEVASRDPASLRTDATIGKSILQASVDGAVSVTYAGAASVMDLQLSMPSVDATIAPVLTGAGNVSGLVGRFERV